jgi:hypothetical protein
MVNAGILPSARISEAPNENGPHRLQPGDPLVFNSKHGANNVYRNSN